MQNRENIPLENMVLSAFLVNVTDIASGFKREQSLVELTAAATSMARSPETIPTTVDVMKVLVALDGQSFSVKSYGLGGKKEWTLTKNGEAYAIKTLLKDARFAPTYIH